MAYYSGSEKDCKKFKSRFIHQGIRGQHRSTPFGKTETLEYPPLCKWPSIKPQDEVGFFSGIKSFNFPKNPEAALPAATAVPLRATWAP